MIRAVVCCLISFVVFTFTSHAEPVPHMLSLSISGPSVKTDNSDSVTVTAQVLDIDRIPVPGIQVTFSCTTGQLSAREGATDENGQAQVEFSSGTEEKHNRIATISVSNPALSTREMKVAVTGTTVSAESPTSALVIGDHDGTDTTSLIVTVRDAGEEPIADMPVTVYLHSDYSNGAVRISESPVKTNALGIAEFTVSGTASGEARIIIEAAGASTYLIYHIDDLGEIFRIIEPAENEITALTMAKEDIAITADSTAISFVDSNPDTIVRSKGSFIADGFHPGDRISVRGSAGNNGGHEISTVTDRVMTLQEADQLTDEPKGARISITNARFITVNNPGLDRIVFLTSLGAWGRYDDITLDDMVLWQNVSAEKEVWAAISSPETGLAEITVFDGDNYETRDSMTIAFTAPIEKAARITLQADSMLIPPNLTPEAIHTATLTATVCDAAGNGVGNAQVAFSIENPTGGGESVTPAIGHTDIYGKVQASFASGSLVTSSDGVIIRAQVLNTDIEDSIPVVIGGTCGSMVMGSSPHVITGNTGSEYILPISVLVADKKNNPIAGAEIILNAWPNRYRTGHLIENDGTCTSIITGEFPAEDQNRNSILDPGEDVNQDNKLTPPAAIAVPDPAKAITNEYGIANFNLIYPKEYALWIETEVTATMMYHGIEHRTSLSFTLPFDQSDVCTLYHSPLNSTNAISLIERTALKTLYTSTYGDKWSTNSGWKDQPQDVDGFAMTGTECSWYGVICNETDTHVVGIDLAGNGLSGSLPAQIGNLVNLEKIMIQNNTIEGPVPPEITSLTHLLDGQSDFRGNLLYTSSDAVKAFLAQKQINGDWENFQSIVDYEISLEHGRPTSTADDESTYTLPLSIRITDPTGAPAADSGVSLDIRPAGYREGYWVQEGGSCSPVVIGEYDSEDANRNKVLDDGEDINGDGRLTPSPDATGILSAPSGTDENGVIDFNLIYPKKHAGWITAEITANPAIEGGITQTLGHFILPHPESGACPNSLPLFDLQPASITLTSPDTTINALPTEQATITAAVQDSSQNGVPDGTTVYFTTTSGYISPYARTVNGAAIATLTASTTPGPAIVQAFAGEATEEIMIEFLPAPGALSLSLSGDTVRTDNSDFVRIEATVLDVDWNPMPGVPVAFSSSGGHISASTVVTGENGTASVTFSSGPTDKRNQMVNIEASVHALGVWQVEVSMTGTSLNASSSTTHLEIGGTDTASLLITVRDAGGTRIPNAPVSITMEPDGHDAIISFSETSTRTNATGEAELTVTGTSPGDARLLVESLGASATVSYHVDSINEEFSIIEPSGDDCTGIVMNKNDIAITADSTTIAFVDSNPDTVIREEGSFLADGFKPGDRIQIRGSAGNNGGFTISELTDSVMTLMGKDLLTDEPMGARVSITNAMFVAVKNPGLDSIVFSSTFGAWGQYDDFDADRVMEMGHVGSENEVWTVISSPETGSAVIDVYDKNNPFEKRDSITISFTAPVEKAANLTLQSDSDVIPPNLTADRIHSTTLTATVQDAAGNGIHNAPVRFRILQPVNGGEYVSPPVGCTDATGIATTSFFPGALPTDSSGIVIEASLLDIGITDSVRIVIDDTLPSEYILTWSGDSAAIGASDSEYTLPLSIRLTDRDGQPIAGTNLALTISPSGYRTGFWVENSGTCLPRITGEYVGEDKNRNGILDPGEDANRDNTLTPPSPAAGAVPAQVTTNPDGIAHFDLVYARKYAWWVDTEITATLQVPGTKAQWVMGLTLPHPESDVCMLPPSPLDPAMSISTVERAALIALYTETNGDSWSANNGWKTTPLAEDGFSMLGSECIWFGVTCDPTDSHVVHLNLPANQLTGSLPAELGNLTHLETLNLSSNRLTGILPAEIGYLSNLRWLFVSWNQLTGAIPDSIGNLLNLEQIWFNDNRLSGAVPTGMTNLIRLRGGQSDFRYNLLSTTDPALRDFLHYVQAGGVWEKFQAYSEPPPCNGFMGDMNGDNTITLVDAILTVQTIAGEIPEGIRVDYMDSGADVNGDARAGAEEALYLLQLLASSRPDTSPTVSIVRPVDGEYRPECAVVELVGAACSRGDRPIDTESLSWSSDQNGQLGDGLEISIDDMPVGQHNIAFTAGDASGVSNTDHVTLTIYNAAGTWDISRTERLSEGCGGQPEVPLADVFTVYRAGIDATVKNSEGNYYYGTADCRDHTFPMHPRDHGGVVVTPHLSFTLNSEYALWGRYSEQRISEFETCLREYSIIGIKRDDTR